MIETTFRTVDLPVADRFDAFRECMIKLHAPMDIRSDHANDFSADMRFVQLGSTCVWPATARSVHMRRTPRLIRQSDPEHYHLTLMTRGSKRLVQARQESTCNRYDMHIADTSRPFHLDVVNRHGDVGLIGVEFPKALLPLPLDKTDRMVNRRISGSEGIGALLAGFLTHLVQHTGSYHHADGPRLEGVLTDLFSAVLAHHLDAEKSLSSESHQRTLILRVRSFIQQHLHDPQLTPTSVAAAHHISTSYLHHLFRTHGPDTTVATWIRHQRLENSRRDLADPAQYAVPVHQIGKRWGFSHHAVFSRVFRAAYGLPPSTPVVVRDLHR